MTDETQPSEDSEPHEENAATGRALAPMFSAGGRPGPGRPRGSLNRTTIVMREAITAVFEDLQADHKGKGSYPHFLAWAKKHPTEFYRIAARQMPVPLENVGRAVGLVVFKGLNDDD